MYKQKMNLGIISKYNNLDKNQYAMKLYRIWEVKVEQIYKKIYHPWWAKRIEMESSNILGM